MDSQRDLGGTLCISLLREEKAFGIRGINYEEKESFVTFVYAGFCK